MNKLVAMTFEEASKWIASQEDRIRDLEAALGKAVDTFEDIDTASRIASVHCRQALATAETFPVSSMDHGGVGQVGCDNAEGTLNIHTANETCEVCAPTMNRSSGDSNAR
jgi:hypothetical protein